MLKFSYFAVPYPLPKLDMVAIPDFAAGAMENYGLVTYRESALLFDERHSAASNKQRVIFRLSYNPDMINLISRCILDTSFKMLL